MDDRVSYRQVAAAMPAAGYIGGKRQLSARLIKMIDGIAHDSYAEPFVGMGGVFFRRTRIPRGEIINDLSGDVATFFRVLQRHYVAFMDMLKWQLTGRREFERLKASNPATLTDLERAARFLYLQRTAFGGKVAGRNFGTDPLGGRFNVTKLSPLLDELHDRLAGVIIECLPWSNFIARYDRPGTLFYLDPPYYGGERDYGAGLFERREYAELATVLSGLKGRFIMTLNDVPAIRRTFDTFRLQRVKLSYTLAGSHRAKLVSELIITQRRHRGL